jgi:hypothetical protein
MRDWSVEFGDAPRGGFGDNEGGTFRQMRTARQFYGNSLFETATAPSKKPGIPNKCDYLQYLLTQFSHYVI